MLSFRYLDDFQIQQGPFCSICMSKFYMKKCFKLGHVFYYQEDDVSMTDTLERMIEKYGGDDPFRATHAFEVAPECSNPKCKATKKSRRPRYVINPPLEPSRKNRLLSGLDSTDNVDELIQGVDDRGFNWRCLCGFDTDNKFSILRHVISEEHLTTDCGANETAIDIIEKLVKDMRLASIRNMAKTAKNKSVEVEESSLKFTIKELDPRSLLNNASTSIHPDDPKPDRIPLSKSGRVSRPANGPNAINRPDSRQNGTSRPASRQNGNASSFNHKPKPTQKPRSLFLWNPTALPLMCQRSSQEGLLTGSDLNCQMDQLRKKSAAVDRNLLDSNPTLKLLFKQDHCKICDVPVSNLPSSLLDHVLDAGHVKRIADVGASRDEITSWISKIETCVRRK